MRVTTADIRKLKAEGVRFATLTAYDAITARLVDEAGIPLVLVGDSLGMAVLGYVNTIPVTLGDVLHHTRAVVRGTRRALVVADLPFMTYHRSVEQAMENAGRCLQEGGAQAVKLEGGRVMAETIARLTAVGIPVLGHIGLTPQSVHRMGGFKVQGKDEKSRKKLIEDAQAVEEAGAYAVVLEAIPADLAKDITAMLSIPTIGIGAGVDCDGQVLVMHDILGLAFGKRPKFVKEYGNLKEAAETCVRSFITEVREGRFPTAEYTYEVK